MRSGDLEPHGKTDERAKPCATTSETGVSALSHGDRTSGAVVDKNDLAESSLVICAPALLLAPTGETVSLNMHVQWWLFPCQIIRILLGRRVTGAIP